MKKLSIVAMMMATMVALCACGNSADKAAEADSSEGEAAQAGSLDSLYSDEFVDLGEYKGLEISVDLSQPTEAEISERIESDLENQSTTQEVSGRAVKDGDIVNIDYVGTKDGVAFDGGTAQGYDLTIGSGQFINGFESGLIGANVGDNIDLNLTFPEQYHSAELAGADVVFNVTVNSISEKVIPELTDEVVGTIGDGYASVDEYKKAISDELYESAKQNAKTTARNELSDKVIENATIKDTPQWLLDEAIETVKTSATSYASMYGVSIEDFVTQALNETMEEFEEECKTYGTKTANQALVLFAIASKENLKVSGDELDKMLDEYATSYGMTKEEMEASGQKESMTLYIQNEKVLDYLLENAKLVDSDGKEISID